MVSQSAIEVLVDEPFVILVQKRSGSGASVEERKPASGRSQIYVVTEDTSKQLISIVKTSHGRFLVSVSKHPAEFEFLSTVSLMGNGQVKLEVQFKNNRPILKKRVEPGQVRVAKRLHFWGHLVPSARLTVTVIINNEGIFTIINVDGRAQSFFQPENPEKVRVLKRQALGQEFIGAVLSSNPPASVRGVNLVHALDNFFTFSIVPREQEVAFESELSGVTYVYPVHAVGPPGAGSSHDRVFVRFSRGQNDSFISGTSSLQLHRYAQGDAETVLTDAQIHHPAFMATLLTANSPLVAEMIQQTHFLNLREVRAVPGVNSLLARESLLDERELPVYVPSVPPETAGLPVAVTSDAGVAVWRSPQAPLMSFMTIASGNSEPQGSYLVDFGDNDAFWFPSPIGALQRLEVFKALYDPQKKIMPIDPAGSPQPPMIPLSFGAATAADSQQDPEGGAFGSWLMPGSNDKKRKQEYSD